MIICVIRVFTPGPPQLDGAAHLRYRQAWQRCGQFPLAITVDSAAEIGETPAEPHFQSCLAAQQYLPVTANQVRPAAIASKNQTMQCCPPSGIGPLTS